ncbi:MAG: MerC domain-containing protein [Gammaproteobacteria bacterium]|jgi:hypothetical protein
MVKKFISLDYAGIAIASTCFLHCLGTLFFLAGYSASSFLYLSFLDNPQIHAIFILASVALGIISLMIAYAILKKSSQINWFIKLLLGIGVFCLLSGLFLDSFSTSNFANILLLSGAAAIALLHVQLLLAKKKITD